MSQVLDNCFRMRGSERTRCQENFLVRLREMVTDQEVLVGRFVGDVDR